VVDVLAVREEVVPVAHAAVCETSLPDWEFGFVTAGEAAFEEH